MGAWGFDTFDNDSAGDWVYDLADSNGLAFVEKTLDVVLTDGADLDAHDACCALAACEVVARWRGNWGARNVYTEDLNAWVMAHPVQPSAALVRKALAAIEQVVGEDSELAELWEGQPEWRDAVAALSQRVRA